MLASPTGSFGYVFLFLMEEMKQNTGKNKIVINSKYGFDIFSNVHICFDDLATWVDFIRENDLAPRLA